MTLVIRVIIGGSPISVGFLIKSIIGFYSLTYSQLSDKCTFYCPGETVFHLEGDNLDGRGCITTFFRQSLGGGSEQLLCGFTSVS